MSIRTKLLAMLLTVTLATLSLLPGASCAVAGGTNAATDPLAGLDEFVQSLLKDWQTPGLALGIVRDGKVIFARGFGERDIERHLPVTVDTSFGLGSTTKAFTALAFQMMVEEGLLDWDRPVLAYMPGFRMHDLFATERITPRDWAVHRSGLSRHDIPFMFNPDLDVTAFINNLQHLEPYLEFRTQGSYSSLGYVILGQLIEQTAKRPWAEVVHDRILEPLGMSQTSFTVEDPQRASQHATQYALVDGNLVPVAFTSMAAVGPAGAMNSNITDMLKWVQFQLNQGRVGDRQLVSPTGLAQTQSPQMIKLSNPAAHGSYGLGWMVESYRGHYSVNHTGNTLGSSSMITLLPQEQIGVVLLSNVQGSPAFPIITNYVIDRLLGLDPIDWNQMYSELMTNQQMAMAAAEGGASGKTGTVTSHPLGAYAGEYRHPSYGTVQVRTVEGKLAAKYYSASFALDHWHFDQFRGQLSPLQPIDVTFRFVTSPTGDVDQVLIDFEGFGHELTFDRIPDAQAQDPVYLERFTGIYSLAGDTVEVALTGSELVLKMTGQKPYPLVPMTGGRFSLKGMPGVTLEFVIDESENRATSALLTESTYTFDLKRVK